MCGTVYGVMQRVRGLSGWSRERVAAGLHDNRAQAQQIGFILMLGVLLLTSVAGAVVGFDQLGQLQNEGSFQQAESEFATIRGQHYELASGVPYRSEEVSLSGGSLSYGDNITISYEVTTPSDSFTSSFETREVTYNSGSERLVYVGGAVFRENTQEGTSLMKVEPQIGTSGSADVVLPFLNVTRVGGMSSFGTGGAGTSSVYFTSYNYDREVSAVAPTDGSGNAQTATVTTTIESERWQQWAQYFREHESYSNVQTDGANNEVSADVSANEIVIYQTRIHVQYTQQTG